MASKTLFLCACLPLLLLNAAETKGQLSSPDIVHWLEPRVVADIDTSTSFGQLSYNEYLTWIDKLLIVDQKYRVQERKISQKSDSVAYGKIWKRIKANDRANEVVLLKLLKKFGWPCNDETRSFKTWIIVWHSDFLPRRNGIAHETFVPFIRRAYKAGCINKKFYLNVMHQMNRQI